MSPLQRNFESCRITKRLNNDVNNPAWVFGDGISKVLNIARERGHITGNQYILERVNISLTVMLIQPLFKPDGTYLFSINAKTGYL